MAEKKATKEISVADNKKNTRVIPRFVRYAIATVMLIIGLLGLAAVFLFRIYFLTESACYDALAVETEDCITQFESSLRSDRVTLRVIAGFIGKTDNINSIETNGYLSLYDINSLITQIGILLPGNDVMTENGRQKNLSGMLDFESEQLLGEHISGSRSFRTNSNAMMLRSYVPICKDGICTGMLFSEANASSMAKAWIPSIYDKMGYCLVVDRKTGAVLIDSSSEDLKDINDISFSQIDENYTKDGTIRNILDGRKGYSLFESGANKEKFYMCYLPFNIEDWEMVALVPESAVFSSVASVRNRMYLLIAGAAAILLLYAVWLVREIRISFAEAEEKANIDVLTGLQNRNRYEAYLKKLAGSEEKIICIFIDANGLHEINNSRGHSAGDQMLRFIADTLKVQFGGDNIYRIGGDEFVVFRSDKTGAEMEECLKAFSEALERNDYYAAVGTCEYENGMSVEQLIANAEKDMYDAKRKYYEHTGKAMRL